MSSGAATTRRQEVLDRLAESGEAAFALDGSGRIVLWNRACELLLNRTADEALGSKCWDTICGRDVYGNVYCYRFCPVAHQARQTREPVRRFTLVVPDNGTPHSLSVATFVLPAGRSALDTIVHVLREDPTNPSPLEVDLEAAAGRRRRPRRPLRTPQGDPVELTAREREILRRLAEGLSTRAVAERLLISPITVRNHVASILTKLDVHTKLAAVAFAFRNGLV
jgi:DNA-binding CsgD family transcriptional regulator